MPDIIQIANQYRAAILKKERAAAVRLIDAYGTAWARLKKNLDKLTEQISDARAKGETVNQFWLVRQERYFLLLRQVSGEMAKFADVAEATITKQQSAAVKAGLSDSVKLMETAADSASISSTFNKLPVAAVENLVGTLGNGSPLRTLLNQLAPSARQIVEQGLIEGVALGRNPTAIARQIREGLGGNMTRALTISRTEVLRSYRSASLASYRQNQDIISGWRWISSKSRRTCLNCLSRDGSIYPLTKPMPAHVRCRCTFAAVLINAPTPDAETGTQWFERQPDEIKKEMMGAKAFAEYKAGKIGLKDFEGEKFNPLWGNSTYQRSLKEIQSQPRPAKPRDIIPPIFRPTTQAPDPLGRNELKRYIDSSHWEAWRNSLSPAEKAGIRDYSDLHYADINNYLRGKNNSPLPESVAHVSGIDSALNRARTDRPLLAFRGLVSKDVYRGFAEGVLKPGDVFEESGFLSTSLDFQAAKEFIEQEADNRVVLRINVPEGSRSAVLGDVSAVPSESELLLGRGSRFRIERVRRRQGVVFVNLTQLGL
jgi:SPP1 gp7 family putative phage head morphogenesis protein